MENVVVKTYSTPFLKLENIFSISDFFFARIMSCMYVCYSYMEEKDESLFV